jgi:hypothetical protein
MCRFESVDCTLALAEIYDKVTIGNDDEPLRPPVE